MTNCKKCDITEGKYNVILNEEGVCNYCEMFDTKKDILLNPEQNEPIFRRKVDKLKGKYKYDALVGLSGGKDSSYVLYKLVKEYNLNVLVVTYDNGFLTEYSKQTIEKIVNDLGVEHFYYKPNWETHKKLYKRAITNFGDPCIGCAFVGFFLAFKLCYENNTPFFIHGRTPYQMYKNMYEGCNDIFLPMINLNFSEHSFSEAAKVNRTANEAMKQFVRKISESSEEAEEFINEFFLDTEKMTDDFTPEFLAYFLFESYNEASIKNKLAEVFDWKVHPGESLLGHNDCAINSAAAYFFKGIHGVSVLEREVASMIRFGCYDIDGGRAAIKASMVSEKSMEDSLQEICKICDYSREDIDKNILKLRQIGIPMFSSR